MSSISRRTKGYPLPWSAFLTQSQGLFGRTLLICLLSLPVAYFLGHRTEEFLFAPMHVAKIEEIAKSLKDPSEKNLSQSCHAAHLVWLFATKTDGQPQRNSKNLVPKGLSLENKSRLLDYGENSFYDAVVKIGDDVYLHGGFRTAPRRIQPLFTADFPWGFFIVCFIWATVLIAWGMVFSVAAPLKRLTELGLQGLSGGKEAREKLSIDPRAPGEVNQLVAAFRSIFEKFDQSLSCQAELRKQVDDLMTRNEKLQQEVLDLLSQSHKNLSEFTSRESEDSLFKFIDRDSVKCESAHEICQKCLDHLSDRFPSSIKHAVFFLPQEGKHNFSLDTYIGLDELSVNVLKAVDPHELIEQAFSKAGVLALDEDDMEQYGLRNCTVTLGWKGALCVPIENKGKRLGLLTVFFDERHESFINDRRRVLEKLQELLARILFRLSTLEQELKSARTDALTGLFNKKFFQELCPDLLRKAKGGSCISFLMLDGDHFKQINDTYGHQAGDLMLKELAGMMIQNTRHTSELKKTKRERDYVIRWGGEEFLILMEGTDARLAATIGERLRKAVAEKTDWPAGITKWSISAGVATYPEDGLQVEELIEKADRALYYCKKVIGRNKMVAYRSLPESARTVASQSSD